MQGRFFSFENQASYALCIAKVFTDTSIIHY
jgi:hypothetical protein